MKTTVIITAGGSGKRMGQPKQFLDILGKPMIEWTLAVFKSARNIDEIILVVAPENIQIARQYGVTIAEGGQERTDSVRNGLKLVSSDTDIILIHDGARPLVTNQTIEDSIAGAKQFGAVVVGVPLKDTVKEVSSNEQPARNALHSDAGGRVTKTLDRNVLWNVQTPQAFSKDIIMKAYEKAEGQATDDSKLVEDLEIPVKMIMGSYENIKITTPEDLIIAEAILRSRNVQAK